MSSINFKCLICNSNDLENDEIITLKCTHVFCWFCLKSHIIKNLDVKIKCPQCEIFISDSVIRQSLSKNEINDYENLCIASIAKSCEQCFQCLLPECDGLVFFKQKDIQFECQRCHLFNCIACCDTHPFLSCAAYQQLKLSALENKKHKLQLESMKQLEFDKAKLFLKNKKHDKLVEDIRELEMQNIIPNDEPFNCNICLKIVCKGEGVKLRNCFHLICKSCLHNSVVNTTNIPVMCLEGSCQGKIDDREIRGILTENEFEMFNDKSLTIAKSQLANIFHCKKPDCKYFVILEQKKLKKLECPLCKSINCIPCKTIHKQAENCAHFQKNFENSTDMKSVKYIEREISQGICMKCPTCGCIIRKTGGCNWIKCPQCKLELCWILKIPRWGPKGNGDNSGGCKCGVNNIPCDPKCLLGCIPEQ